MPSARFDVLPRPRSQAAALVARQLPIIDGPRDQRQIRMREIFRGRLWNDLLVVAEPVADRYAVG